MRRVLHVGNDELQEPVSNAELIRDLVDLSDSSDPVLLVVNSDGGNIYLMTSIVDAVQAAPFPVYTQVLGIAASAAAGIATCGVAGNRWISTNSDMMIHLPRTGGEDMEAGDIVRLAHHATVVTARYLRILAEGIGDLSPERMAQLETDVVRDNWMTATDSVAYGLVDQIGVCPLLFAACPDRDNELIIEL